MIKMLGEGRVTIGLTTTSMKKFIPLKPKLSSCINGPILACQSLEFKVRWTNGGPLWGSMVA